MNASQLSLSPQSSGAQQSAQGESLGRAQEWVDSPLGGPLGGVLHEEPYPPPPGFTLAS